MKGMDRKGEDGDDGVTRGVPRRWVEALLEALDAEVADA
jgi:hypothetical protein